MRIHLFFLLAFSFFSCGDDTMEPPPVIMTPSLTIDPLSVVEGNANKSVFLSLRLNQSPQSTVSATLQTSDKTATAGEDYIAINDQIVEFAAGIVQANVKIDIIGDEDPEQDESFTIKVTQISGATISNDEIEVIIENDDVGTDVTIPSTGYSTPSSYPNLNLLWSDEFDGTELNQNDWTYEIGNGSSGWGNNELQFYREENTSIVDGHLVIQARNEFYNGFNYTSSRLITKNKFEFTFGRVDIRAALPEGQGLWPALWMLGANISEVGWPKCGEIDIMEIIGSEPSKVHGTVHYPDSSGNRLFRGGSETLPGGAKFSQEFHVFSVIWLEDRIDWYLDDQLYFTATPASLGASNPYPFNDPFFFIFNVAVGGDWPGSPNENTTFPQSMIVDYIRVFQE